MGDPFRSLMSNAASNNQMLVLRAVDRQEQWPRTLLLPAGSANR